jgi:predicted TIM-barrel fold metal-dependent hydrolase
MTTVDVPWIVSVDDHVIEPPSVWASRLPAKYREVGPRVERLPAGDLALAGAKYVERPGTDGPLVDYWVYGDLYQSLKRAVAASGRDRDDMTMTATTYDDVRPGCFEPSARVKDMDANWTQASLCFPNFPRFCGQTFLEASDRELAALCVRAYNDWMVEEWCEPSGGMNLPLCLMPLWDIGLAAEEIRRNAARGVRAFCFSELPTRLSLPSIHTGHWDPVFDVCNDTGVTLCMHIGSSSSNPAASPDAPEGVGGTLAFNNSMASLADWLFSGKLMQFPKLKIAYSEGQIGWIPYALERADTVWDQHDAWQHSKEIVPEPPSTYYYGRIFGCFTADRVGLNNLETVGVDNICFETDYPHTDTTWPDSKEYVEKMVADAGLDDETAYKVLRGNAIRILDLDRV